MSRLGINGGYVGYRRVPTESAAIGMWSIIGAYLGRLGSIWPGLIDVGPGAINRTSTVGANYTYVDVANPANRDGTVISVELWFASNATGVKVATFSKSGSVFTPRDVETIGDVTAGSKQTFSGLSLTVVAGDYIGIYFSGGTMEFGDTSDKCWYKAGDQTEAGAQTYTEASTAGNISIYGTG